MRALVIFFSVLLMTVATGCEEFHNVPPNDIGMLLTPNGYSDKIYTPGQVDIGKKDRSGEMSRLVLIQRSGVEVKEQFLGKIASPDKEDHRCLLGDKTPMTFDVRLLLALPDYGNSQGKKDLARLFHLGNPREVENTEGRVLRISSASVYQEQAEQHVRGRLRQLCANFPNFDAVFAALTQDDEKGLVKRVEQAVVEVLAHHNVPLRLVSAFPSNIKPDESVIEAISALQAAQKRMEAIKAVTDFLDQDKTGSRVLVYQMQTWQEIVSAGNANGHNTIMFTPGAPAGAVPLPVGAGAGSRKLRCSDEPIGRCGGWRVGARGGRLCPLHPQRGSAPAPRPREKGLAAPSLLAISHPGFVHNARRVVGPHAPWRPRVHVCIKLRARPSLHTSAQMTTTRDTRQRRVPALHMCSQMTAMRSPWQRRVPRALVHRPRPRGWALVTYGGKRKHERATPQPQPQPRTATRMQMYPLTATDQAAPATGSSIAQGRM
jgi:hypothetical protein